MTETITTTETKKEESHEMLSLPVRVALMIALVIASFASWTWGLGTGVVTGVVIMFALITHELGHAIAFRLFHVPLSGIYFLPFFGAATVPQIKTQKWEPSWEMEGITALAGPLLGFVGSLVLLIVAQFSTPYSHLLLLSAAFFAGLNLLNMIPIVPFDGGRVARAIVIGIAAFRPNSPDAVADKGCNNFDVAVLFGIGSIPAVVISYVLSGTVSSMLAFVFSIGLFQTFLASDRMKKEKDTRPPMPRRQAMSLFLMHVSLAFGLCLVILLTGLVDAAFHLRVFA